MTFSRQHAVCKLLASVVKQLAALLCSALLVLATFYLILSEHVAALLLAVVTLLLAIFVCYIGTFLAWLCLGSKAWLLNKGTLTEDGQLATTCDHCGKRVPSVFSYPDGYFRAAHRS